MKIDKPKLPQLFDSADNLQEMMQDSAEAEEDLQEQSFLNEELHGIFIHSVTIRACKFEKCAFAGFQAENVYFTDTVFEHCDLSNAEFSGCCFRRVEFINCKIVGTNFTEPVFDSVTLKNCAGTFMSLSSGDIKKVCFEHTDLANASFQECRLKNVKFDTCSMVKAEFLHTPLKDIDLTSDDISGIILAGPELRGAVVTSFQACDLARYLGLVIQ